MIRAVIFDFGYVLCTFDPARLSHMIAQSTGDSAEDISAILMEHQDWFDQFEEGRMQPFEMYKRITRQFILEWTFAEFYRHYSQRFSPIDENVSLLHRLADAGYLLGMLTNTSETDFHGQINGFGFIRLFDHVTRSYEVGALKPDPLIYRHSLIGLGVRADEAVFIDDLERNVLAFERLGGRGIVYRGNGQNLASELAI